MNQSLAYIHPDAKIAKNTVIESFAYIEGDVEIGEGSWIGPNAVIMNGARIGKNCKIFPGAVISAVPQDLKYKGEITYTYIGDNTIIRESATVNKGTVALGYTRVGNNCLIMATAHIAHDCVIGNNVIVVNGTGLSGHVTVEDYAILGGLTAVHQFNKIGKHAITAGGAMVRKDVPPFVEAGRYPLAYVGVNIVGLKRRGFSDEKITEIKDIYRVIFQKGLTTSKALSILETDFAQTEERDEIIEFIKTSERGIIKGFKSTLYK